MKPSRVCRTARPPGPPQQRSPLQRPPHAAAADPALGGAGGRSQAGLNRSEPLRTPSLPAGRAGASRQPRARAGPPPRRGRPPAPRSAEAGGWGGTRPGEGPGRTGSGSAGRARRHGSGRKRKARGADGGGGGGRGAVAAALGLAAAGPPRPGRAARPPLRPPVPGPRPPRPQVRSCAEPGRELRAAVGGSPRPPPGSVLRYPGRPGREARCPLGPRFSFLGAARGFLLRLRPAKPGDSAPEVRKRRPCRRGGPSASPGRAAPQKRLLFSTVNQLLKRRLRLKAGSAP